MPLCRQGSFSGLSDCRQSSLTGHDYHRTPVTSSVLDRISTSITESVASEDYFMASNSSSQSSAHDNIRVASANPMIVDSSDEEGDPLADLSKLGHPGLEVGGPEGHTLIGKGVSVTQNGTGDVDMPDADNADDKGSPAEDDDNVTEYSFKSEDYPHESELEEDLEDDDVRSHISLSDDEPEVPPVNTSPFANMTREHRLAYEHAFVKIFPHPLHGSWEATEAYQEAMDRECHQYLKLFKVEDWIIPRNQAESAIAGLFERTRLRSDGEKIYGPQGVYTRTSYRQPAPFPQNQLPVTLPATSPHQGSRSQAGMRPIAPPGITMGRPMRQQMPFAQGNHYGHRSTLLPALPGHMPRGTPYAQSTKTPHQSLHGMKTDPGAQGSSSKTSRKLKLTVGDPLHGGTKVKMAPPALPALKAPVPPYPVRTRPDTRRTVGKAGRGKIRRQAEADEFPWNRELDFVQAKNDAKENDPWDYSVYDRNMLAAMARTRVRNEPVVDVLEKEISEKQSRYNLVKSALDRKFDHLLEMSRKNGKMKAAPKVDASSEDETAVDEAAGDEAGPSTKGGRKKSRSGAETGNDPYHSGNFAFASPEDQTLASTMGARSVDELIEAGEADKISLDELFRIKICWSPGKKGNSQDLEQAKFSVKDTVVTRKMLARTPILTHRASECLIDFCPDLLWRDILLRILSEGGFSNKDIRDRFCLNGTFSDRATVAKRLGAALGKDTNPPRGKGKEAAADWCETNRDDFDNYQAFFGKRPPARRTAQGRKKARLENGKGEVKDEEDTTEKSIAETGKGKGKAVQPAVDGANDDAESVDDEAEQAEAEDDAVSLQDSDDLDAMSD